MDIIGTTAVHPKYVGIRISEISSTFPIGVAMCTHATVYNSGTPL